MKLLLFPTWDNAANPLALKGQLLQPEDYASLSMAHRMLPILPVGSREHSQ